MPQQHLRILAVDDDPALLKLYEHCLAAINDAPRPAAFRLDEGKGAVFVGDQPGGEEARFELTTAAAAEDAVNKVREALDAERPFAAAFVDVRLGPGPNGIWAAEQIRAMDPRVIIVIVTGYSDVPPEEIAVRVPPIDRLFYVQKPFLPEEIRQFVLSVAGRWREELNLPSTPAEIEAVIQDRCIDWMRTNEKLQQEILERRRMEEALRESERKFRNLAETTSAAVFIHRDGKLRYVNPAAAELFETTVEQLHTMSVWDLVHPDFRALAQERANQRQHGHEAVSRYEVKMLTMSGASRWLDLCVQGIDFEDGRAVMGTAFDVTERKKAEQALRESEEKYRNILESMDEGYYEVDLKGRFRFFNDATCRLFGCTREALQDADYRDFCSEATGQVVFETFNRVYVTGEPERAVDWEVLCPDGVSRFFEVSIALRRDPDGAPLGFRGIMRDVTERKQAEAERLRLAMAVEQAAETIVVTNPYGVIQYVNPAFEAVTGYTREEAIGCKPSLLKSGRHDTAFYADLWETITSGRTWQGHLINKSKTGRLFEEEATISPVRGPGGKTVNYVAVKRDVTNEMQMARQLSQAQRMEAIGTLAGGIAHDFNNILAAVFAYTDLARDELAADSPVRNHLNRVLRAGMRAKELVEQILTFSRQQDTELQYIEFHLIVKETMKLLRAAIPSTVRIEQEVDPASGIVRANATQLHQMIMNLCTNAHQAMQPGGGTLTVQLAPLNLDDDAPGARQHNLVPGEYIRLVVADTGCGMDEATLDRIFDPFFTTKEDWGGTGLGLSTVHGIVAALRGAITVESKPDEGTTFMVYLPRARAAAKKTEAAPEEAPQGQGEHVLLVDDEPDLLDAGEQMLTRLGYRVLAFKEGGEALATFRGAPADFDLIITDQTMPRMTGAEQAQEVLKIRPDMPIVLSTGFSDVISADQAREIGIREYFMKPYLKHELGQVLRRALTPRDE